MDTRPKKAKRLIKIFVDPLCKTVSQEQLLQSRYLSLILLILSILSFFLGFLPRIFLQDVFGSNMPLTLIIFAGVVIFIIAYFLARFCKITVSTLISVTTMLLAILSATAYTEELFPFIVLPVLFSSVFLSKKDIYKVSIAILIISYLFFQFMQGGNFFDILSGYITFELFVIALAIFIREFRSKIDNLRLQQIEEKESFVRTIVESASDVIITVNEAGEIIYWNRVAEELFGYTFEEINNKSVTTILSPKIKKDLEKMAEDFETAQKGHSPISTDVDGLTKFQKRLLLELSISSWEQGNELFFTIVARDVTRKREYEKERKEYLREIEKLNKLMIGREVKMAELKRKLDKE